VHERSHWVCGLRSSAGILNTRKHKVLQTGCVCVCTAPLGLLRRGCLQFRTTDKECTTPVNPCYTPSQEPSRFCLPAFNLLQSYWTPFSAWFQMSHLLQSQLNGNGANSDILVAPQGRPRGLGNRRLYISRYGPSWKIVVSRRNKVIKF
jgi:hypothetical protein